MCFFAVRVTDITMMGSQLAFKRAAAAVCIGGDQTDIGASRPLRPWDQWKKRNDYTLHKVVVQGQRNVSRSFNRVFGKPRERYMYDG